MLAEPFFPQFPRYLAPVSRCCFCRFSPCSCSFSIPILGGDLSSYSIEPEEAVTQGWADRPVMTPLLASPFSHLSRSPTSGHSFPWVFSPPAFSGPHACQLPLFLLSSTFLSIGLFLSAFKQASLFPIKRKSSYLHSSRRLLSKHSSPPHGHIN